MNNIFRYATKELSQDAFIAWILSFATMGKEKYEQEESALYWSLAQNYLNKFVNKTRMLGTAKAEYMVDKIAMQEDKIDVFAIIYKADEPSKKIALIIEDKVYTSYHDNQIERYYSKKKNQYPDYEIKVIYYKTGPMVDEEDMGLEMLRKKGINIDVIRLDDIMDILGDLKVKDTYNIINMYKQYLSEKNQERLRVRRAIEEYKGNIYGENNYLNTEYGQFVLMDHIFKNRKKLVMDDSEPISFKDFIYNGSSRGTPWTQYWFFEEMHHKEDVANSEYRKSHGIFWRLDTDRISLRYYVNSGLIKPEHDETLNALREICSRIVTDGWKETRNHATYEFSLIERRIGENDTYSNIISEVSMLHKDFLKELEMAGALS